MRKLSNFDKILMGGIFILVIAIFVLAFVIHSNGGQCVLNPYSYANAHNLTNPYLHYITP